MRVVSEAEIYVLENDVSVVCNIGSKMHKYTSNFRHANMLVSKNSPEKLIYCIQEPAERRATFNHLRFGHGKM